MERLHEDGPAKRSTSPALAMALTLGVSAQRKFDR